ncbi:MAG TPA: outer membrane beta-barrel protein [Nitrospira sp.]|nr:outer membrane beta-barrel protein [Nitrospira sp.]
MSDVFQPYGGIGYGMFFATGSKNGQSTTQINPGFQFVAGARYVLTQEWALFGEFKYNNTEIRFSGIKGNYDSQNFVVGLMWHFGR